jgi:AraC-like DNA-binding protein
MNDLSHTSKRLPDNADYPSEANIRLKKVDVPPGNDSRYSHSVFNHLIFVDDGELLARYNEFQPIRAHREEFFFIPQLAEFAIQTLSEAHLYVFSFDSLNEIYNKRDFRVNILSEVQKAFVFKALPFHPILKNYLQLISYYFLKGINPPQMDKLKFKELFLLFKFLYNKEELNNLFYPLLSKSLDFKHQVIQYSSDTTNVNELANKIGMGRTNFDRKFKIEFGISPLQWLLKEKAKHVYFSLSEPESTLSDIMQKYNFNSPTHLNRFCKQQFGLTPSELRKKLNSNG